MQGVINNKINQKDKINLGESAATLMGGGGLINR